MTGIHRPDIMGTHGEEIDTDPHQEGTIEMV